MLDKYIQKPQAQTDGPVKDFGEKTAHKVIDP
jgi:hypothetical protein